MNHPIALPVHARLKPIKIPQRQLIQSYRFWRNVLLEGALVLIFTLNANVLMSFFIHGLHQKIESDLFLRLWDMDMLLLGFFNAVLVELIYRFFNFCPEKPGHSPLYKIAAGLTVLFILLTNTAMFSLANEPDMKITDVFIAIKEWPIEIFYVGGTGAMIATILWGPAIHLWKKLLKEVPGKKIWKFSVRVFFVFFLMNINLLMDTIQVVDIRVPFQYLINWDFIAFGGDFSIRLILAIKNTISLHSYIVGLTGSMLFVLLHGLFRKNSLAVNQR